MKKPKIFMSYSLHRDQELANKIVEYLGRDNYDFFIPSEAMPLGINATATQIMQSNMNGVKQSDIIIAIFNRPGEGVEFECGVAKGAGKKILAYLPHDISAPEWWKDQKHPLHDTIGNFAGFIEELVKGGCTFSEIGLPFKICVESMAKQLSKDSRRMA